MDPIPIPSDTVLVEGLKNRSQEAWRNFDTGHSQRLIRIMKSYGVPESDIDDAYNELLYKILLNLPKYKLTIAPFETWINTIAKNHALDWIKTKNFKDRKDTLSLDEKALTIIRDPEIDQSNNNRSTLNEKIDSILTQHFTERQRTLISLKITNGCSWKDVYDIMVPQEYPSQEAARKECSRLLPKLEKLLAPFI